MSGDHSAAAEPVNYHYRDDRYHSIEEARYMVASIGPVKPGDTVWVSERQDDGTWSPPREVIVADDTATTDKGEDE